MAVYAAHLTRTLQGTPSIFQVTAQEALGATVKPALRKIVEYLSSVYPGRLDKCLLWYDELYLLLDLCLQRHYLKHYAASFSESFYGLHRVPTPVPTEFSLGHRLSPQLERASLALLVLAPYISGKMQYYANKWRADDEDGRLGKSLSDRVRRLHHRLYGLLHLALEGARAGLLGAYLCGRAPSHSAGLAALGLALRPAPPRPLREPYSLGELLTGQIGPVGAGLLQVVEYGAFLVQFLRWWDSRPRTHQESRTAPPPPQGLPSGVGNVCPVCLRPWRTPTALPVSGLVYCYSCISRSLRERGRCPVTGHPAEEGSLLRLYLPPSG